MAKKAKSKEQKEKPIDAKRKALSDKQSLSSQSFDKQSLSSQSFDKQETEWFLFDAKGEVLGRLATQISKILQGKHKSDFVPYREMADNVVVINAGKIRVTGKKEKQKIYTSYSGYPGGLKRKTVSEVRTKNPEFLIYHAVSGMLPKNKLAKLRLKKLHIFAGAEHPYQNKVKN